MTVAWDLLTALASVGLSAVHRHERSGWRLKMSMLLANDRSRFLSRRLRLVLPIAAAAVFLVTASVNQAQDAPPEDYVAPESVDLTADS